MAASRLQPFGAKVKLLKVSVVVPFFREKIALQADEVMDHWYFNKEVAPCPVFPRIRAR